MSDFGINLLMFKPQIRAFKGCITWLLTSGSHLAVPSRPKGESVELVAKQPVCTIWATGTEAGCILSGVSVALAAALSVCLSLLQAREGYRHVLARTPLCRSRR